ncbi:hypothetical protein [Legionella fairfieldensis]|uniref:hypothetical protein n=1 Tax=Legionella fairfieldensis TaxID=45064 RepID=UPI000686837E|nr:hypothetical protein [Legionella fairfieldensis]
MWSEQKAKALHEARIIYAIYGALDGLSISYSTFKYFFDVHLSDSHFSSSDVMHDWMVAPEGILITATSSLTLIAFSLLANHFDDEKDKKNTFKRYINTIWPYCRDILKGLKNAYKGIRSTFQTIHLLSGQNLTSLIVPVGLLLGCLSVVNRIWALPMKNKRKAMKKDNAALLKSIQHEDYLKGDNLKEKIARDREKIQGQSIHVKKMGLLSSCYAGIVDGLYLYVGILGLCSLVPPVLIAMVSFCSICLLACIATRMYEEYNFQREVVISQAEIELYLYGREVELMYADLEKLSLLGNQTLLKNHLNNLIKKAESFEAKRKELFSLKQPSYISAFLRGLKHGLALYGVLTSFMFTVSIILVLSSVAFPPAFLMVCVALGVVSMAGFVIHSLIEIHRTKKNAEKGKEILLKSVDQMSHGDLVQLFKQIDATEKEIKNWQLEKIKEKINKRIIVDPSPQFFFQEWFEVILEIARSCFSGAGKGCKAIDYTMNPLQEADEKGHYHDTPIMFLVMVASSLIHSIALALRTYSRGFGKLDKAKKQVLTSESDKSPSLQGKPEKVREPEKVRGRSSGFFSDSSATFFQPSPNNVNQSKPLSPGEPEKSRGQRPGFLSRSSSVFFPPPSPKHAESSRPFIRSRSADSLGQMMSPV